MTELVRDLDAESLATPVPVCPGWTVRDLLCHMVGLPTDVNAGRIEGAGTDPWTAAQLASRTTCDRDALLEEWQREAPAFEAIIPMIDPPRRSTTSSCTSKTCAARSECPARGTAQESACSRSSRCNDSVT